MKKNKIIKVALFQPALPKYRVPIYKKLSKEKNINLTVFYGCSPNIKNVVPENIIAFKTDPWRIQLFGEEFIFDISWVYESMWGNYDVFVYAWNIHFVFLVPAIILARLRKRGVVLWGHGYSKRERPWRKIFRYLVGHLADVAVVYNKTTTKKFIREGWNPRRIFAAPNTLDQTDIQIARKYWLARMRLLKAFRIKYGICTKNTILFCSRLEYQNRVDILITAHKELLIQNPKSKLIIIGGGPEEENLKKMVMDLGLSASVIFLGALYEEKSLAPFFLLSGAFCYPRNIGLSILHSFGYGLPVVTSNDLSAQNPEIESLKNGRNGFLYRDGDVSDLINKLRQILEDGTLRKNLGAEALRTALEDYSIKDMVDGLRNSFLAAEKLQDLRKVKWISDYLRTLTTHFDH